MARLQFTLPIRLAHLLHRYGFDWAVVGGFLNDIIRIAVRLDNCRHAVIVHRERVRSGSAAKLTSGTGVSVHYWLGHVHHLIRELAHSGGTLPRPGTMTFNIENYRPFPTQSPKIAFALSPRILRFSSSLSRAISTRPSPGAASMNGMSVPKRIRSAPTRLTIVSIAM